jgi:hypothetical protein
MSEVSDKKRTTLEEEMDWLRDGNDWVSDRRRVVRRTILKASSPQWTESPEIIEAHYGPIWDSGLLRVPWIPPEEPVRRR